MPTYTVLGGTGSTGSAILRSLSPHSPSHASIRVLVRSEEKLLNLLPALKSRPNTTIFKGAIDDPGALRASLDGTDYIFSCVALGGSEPGMTIAADTAGAIISALKQLRDGHGDAYRPPTVVMLSAAPVNPRFAKDMPRPVVAFLHTALAYNYRDLQVAQDAYRSVQRDNPGLLTAIFAQPAAIMSSVVPTGYRLSLDGTSSSISYADLGAGMVEMAERKEEFGGQGVGIIATGKVVQNWGPNIHELFFGLIAYFLPGIWRKGRAWGWW